MELMLVCCSLPFGHVFLNRAFYASDNGSTEIFHHHIGKYGRLLISAMHNSVHMVHGHLRKLVAEILF